MKKNIADLSWKEFDAYCNARACDGRWNYQKALMCFHLGSFIVWEAEKAHPILKFRQKKVCETLFELYKGQSFDSDEEFEFYGNE